MMLNIWRVQNWSELKHLAFLIHLFLPYQNWLIITQESGIPADAQVLLPLSGSNLPLSKGNFFTILLIDSFSRLWLFHDCAHCKFLHIEIIVTFVIIVLIVIYWDSSPQTSQWRLLWQLHQAPILFFSGFHIFNSYLQYIFIIFSTYLKNIFNISSTTYIQCNLPTS